ncbi:MAG: RidA family protein [Pseudomonadota bacterium]
MIERHGSGGPWEDVAGYSRVVRAGDHVWVAGCTATLPDGALAGLGDPHAQAVQAIENVAAALERVGATLGDVVRTRIAIVDRDHADAVIRAHGDAFRDVRPAAALYVVAGLLDPRMLVEIEADAVVAGR